MTLFMTVRSVARSREFYTRVVGGTVVLGENPCLVGLSNSWILTNPGGPRTRDKPGISVVDYQRGDTSSIFLNLRIPDIQAGYGAWKEKGAEFVTPIDPVAELRCYMRDPDGYLIGVGQSADLLDGKLAANRPEDLAEALPAVPAESYSSEALVGKLPPLGRVGQVSDVMDGILYLESAPYVTGEILHIDAGRITGHRAA